MRFYIRKCSKCGRYTLKETCPVDNTPTVNPHPPKFSPQDKYAKYRGGGTMREDVQPSENPAQA